MDAFSRRTLVTSLLAAAALAAGGGAAVAQIDAEFEQIGYRRRRHRRYRRYERTCRKACPNDMSPCDSPQAKAADGRCANPVGGPNF